MSDDKILLRNQEGEAEEDKLEGEIIEDRIQPLIRSEVIPALPISWCKIIIGTLSF